MPNPRQMGEKTLRLVEKLGLQWQDVSLLETALTHPSFSNECKGKSVQHNQRLEFLGDAVLELVISDYVFSRFPKHEEGVLTKIRAAVVCEPSLAKAAMNLELGANLRMGRGEERSGGRERPAGLADAFEALVGAIYLDQGLTTARGFVLQQLDEAIAAYGQGAHAGDFKSELQELVQQYSDQTVSYVILEEKGPDHNKSFTAAVRFGEQQWGQGTGRTKKEAEQLAAHAALQSFKSKAELRKRILGK